MGQDHNIKPTAQEEGIPEITWGQTCRRTAHLDWLPVDPEAGTSPIDEVPSIMKNNTGGMGLAALLALAQPLPPEPVPVLAPPPVLLAPTPPVLLGLLVPPVLALLDPPVAELPVPPLPGLPVPPVAPVEQSPQAPLTHWQIMSPSAQ
jgi:hypothetical protein